MSTKITNKQVKIISNVDFNEKEIENAIIDAEKNEITNLDIPTKVSDLENDSGYTTTADVNSEIIANSNSIDQELNENSYNAVTNNAIVDDQIDYKIAGVCTSKENAKKLFFQTVKDVKCDSDFEEINPIKITDDMDLSKIDSEWCYEEDDYGFNLYLNGEYNSNNFSVQIERFKLDNILELDNKELV